MDILLNYHQVQEVFIGFQRFGVRVNVELRAWSLHGILSDVGLVQITSLAVLVPKFAGDFLDFSVFVLAFLF